MTINWAETDTFSILFAPFAQEHNINVSRYCATKLLSFYNYNLESIMLFQLDATVVSPLVLKPFKNFNVKTLVRNLICFLGDVSKNKLGGFVPEDFFSQFSLRNIESIILKQNYTSVHDIAYYRVELINSKHSVDLFINLHTDPVKSTFAKKKSLNNGLDYLEIDVYYKDFKPLIKPMMAYYAILIGEFLNIHVDEVDEKILKLLEMVKF